MWSFTNSCVDVMPSLDSCGALLYVAWLSELRFLGYNCCLIDWDFIIRICLCLCNKLIVSIYMYYITLLIFMCILSIIYILLTDYFMFSFFYYVLSDVEAPYSV
jgi:hypothetical protein